ncbi:MAG TPA: carboxy terminal-processing peptidase [Chitinophagaceae bacterium]
MCKPVLGLLLLCVLLTSGPVNSQVKKFQNQVITLKRVIEREHYSPRAVNDAFSGELFDEFIERLDPYKLYFTEADVTLLAPFRQQLDDELNGRQWGFLDKFLPLYQQRLKKADSLVSLILQKPLDLMTTEKLALGKDSLKFVASDQQLKLKWQRWLTFRIMEFLADHCSMRKSDAKTCLGFESLAREKTKATELRNIRKLLQHPSGYDKYITSIYCETIANLFDPHTAYMAPEDKEAFESGLGTEGLYFGLAVMENEKGEIELAQLMPGSPAWKSGELNIGDVVLQLAWEGREAITMEGATAAEASAILNQSNDSRLDITVRKKDGLIKKVKLAKELIRNDDHEVKGFILKGERKIGYIYLPGFYTTFEGMSESSCANDVAKEIVKLKKENIQGLILDVRYNGGGSMQEALEMAGIFIDEGPLALIREKNGKAISLKDMNRGTIYDGPLLLLVNGQSASASELLAAVLQDYNRAIVAGGNTFGKGTAQIILPVDTSLGAATNQSPEYGFVKVTGKKFYRVNGTTTQLQGVKPDIILPEIYYEDYTEAALPNAMQADTTQRNKYYKPFPPISITQIRQKSEARVSNHSGFHQVNKAATLIKQEEKLSGPEIISLRWNDFYSSFQNSHQFPEITEIEKKFGKGNYEADNTMFDKEKIGTNTYTVQMNGRWKERITYDIYIQEAYNIIQDLILTNKPN